MNDYLQCPYCGKDNIPIENNVGCCGEVGHGEPIETENKTMKYPIGTKFISRSNKKHKRVQTIVDYLTTTNLKGEVVRERYVATHDFMGQKVTDNDIIPTSIDMGEIINENKADEDPEAQLDWKGDW